MIIRIKDPFSGLSHLAGALFSVAGLVILVTLASFKGTAWHVVSFSVYGTSMILLYTASTLYHLLPVSEKGTRIFKSVDHIMIFFLIAGTYTPFCLVPLRGPWGYSLLAVVWGIAAAGIFFTIFWLNAPRWLRTGIYISMGLICLVAIFPLLATVPLGGLMWLLLGGASYLTGALIYAFKKPDPWPGKFGFHEIFHIFVLVGSFGHFMCMLLYVMHIA